MPAPRKATKKRASSSTEVKATGAERLQKVLAAAGVGSRRDCEELILEGRVDVDGDIVQELGTRVDPMTQRIRVDGTELRAPRRVYYMLNKPSGVLCTANDPSGRQRAIDLVKSNERLFTVGRLDQNSQGLILLTNDGELSNKLTHPRYGIEKVYRVHVAGVPEAAMLTKLKRGIHFADGFAKVSSVKIKSKQKQSATLEIVLNEGRNREIRRLLARVGHKVLSLTRTAMGPLRLADLPSGAHRKLTREEVKQLRDAILNAKKEEQPPTPSKAAKRKRPSTARNQESTPARAKAKPAARKRPPSNKKPPSNQKATSNNKSLSRDLIYSDGAPSGAILGGDEPTRSKPVDAKRNKSKSRKTAAKGKSPTPGKAKRKGRR